MKSSEKLVFDLTHSIQNFVLQREARQLLSGVGTKVPCKVRLHIEVVQH